MRNLKKILILGSGGLSIGQAGEFDYSGSQAIKALKEEGMSTVLINPNIATVQTSEKMADTVYFLPVTPEFVIKVIEKEQPDGILLSFGGQTALNCGVALMEQGIFEKYNIRVLGTPVEIIQATEDRDMFKSKLAEIGVEVATSAVATNMEEGKAAARQIGFPLIIRAAYALGGLGSGFCEEESELEDSLSKAFSHSNQVLIDESLKGWKEVEYEVMRDSMDNCITICNMENFDPLGIHTGESIVVVPSQTLNDVEYFTLRKVSIEVIRHLGVIGECNIQFALNPEKLEYRVIEVNARLSRSSALASKASGYPIAYVAAKLALGYTLSQITNPVTLETTAYFEPAIDYLAIKFPRWDLEKFKHADTELGSAMKSVGEVMALGRTFEETMQKAIRMSKDSYTGLVDDFFKDATEDPDYELSHPSHQRIFTLAHELKRGRSIEELYELTKIDRWFLHKLAHIVEIDQQLSTFPQSDTPLAEDSSFVKALKAAKRAGFSDKQIALRVFDTDDYDHEASIRQVRHQHGLHPAIKQIDTLGGEYPAQTNYLYTTYNGSSDDIAANDKKSIVVLGSGAYSIGSSVEFDWSCVNCVNTLKDVGYSVSLLNYNPETVSTDYDVTDRLYFDELTLETILEINRKEKPEGFIISFGGQIPNNLAPELNKAGVPVLGTKVTDIERAENRHVFSQLLDDLDVDQPQWQELSSLEDIKAFVSKIGFPVLIRPSFVLSGALMRVAYSLEDLERKLEDVSQISNDYPVVVSKFISNAKEIEMDAVAEDGEIIVYAISEHVENAGVHSGDATLVTPAQKLYLETTRRIKKISRQVIRALNVTGPVNIQFIAKDNNIKIIECNLRASRTFPFVSKIYGVNFVEVATKAILGVKMEPIQTHVFDLDYLGIKAPQFSFTRLRGADPILGVEMTSTGEVACLGEDITSAFVKALLASGFKLPTTKTVLLSTGTIEEKSKFLSSVRTLHDLGYQIYATEGTAQFYELNGIDTTVLHWPESQEKPNALDFIKGKELGLVINIPKNNEDEELSNDYRIRRGAVDYGIPLITNLEVAVLFVEVLRLYGDTITDLPIRSWQEYLGR